MTCIQTLFKHKSMTEFSVQLTSLFSAVTSLKSEKGLVRSYIEVKEGAGYTVYCGHCLISLLIIVAGGYETVVLSHSPELQHALPRMRVCYRDLTWGGAGLGVNIYRFQCVKGGCSK